MNDTIVLNVMCNPNNRVALIDGTLTVTNDLAMNPNRTVPLKCNSNTASVALTPATMMVDFGATDLDAIEVSVTRTITLMNPG